MSDSSGQGETVCTAFQRTAAQFPDRVALRTKGGALTHTWGEYAEQVRRIAAGLWSLGVRHGDTVALQLTNRPEFHFIDMAAVHLGAVPFSIYNTSPPGQILERLENSDARVIVTEQAFVDAVREAAGRSGRVEQLVLVDGTTDRALTLDQMIDGGARASDLDFDARWRAVTPDDLLTITYTSGTTGPPKGAQWSHRGAIATIQALRETFIAPEQSISYLPMAHAGERMFTHLWPLLSGTTVTCCPNPAEILTYVLETRPDQVSLPPRIWEKLRPAIDAQIEQLPPEELALVRDGLNAGLERVRAEAVGEQVVASLTERHELAKELVRRTVLSRFGLDRVVTPITGAAPSRPELIEGYHVLGLPILEGYGMTECGGISIFNRHNDFRIGTVGRPVPGLEARLDEDGEILLRGPLVMVGYRKNPEATAEVLDSDGWLHTGDVGAIDGDGYMRIVDRKKELIINSHGKNMSPVNIEAEIKSACPLVSQVMVVGDRRPYNVALVTLDPEALRAFEGRAGRELRPIVELAEAGEVLAAVDDGLGRGNARLSRVEQIKRYAVLADEWLPDSDELTPTMKLKRKQIAVKYEALIDALYAAERTTGGRVAVGSLD